MNPAEVRGSDATPSSEQAQPSCALPIMRHVWRMPRARSLAALHLEAEPLSPPGPGEVRVAVRAAGLNLADVFACLGLYSATPPGSFVPGLEVAGIVDAVGPRNGASGVSSPLALRTGDHVVAVTRFGGYATALNVDSRYLRRLPYGWSFSEGAAFPVQAITAWYAAHELGRIRPGEVVLVHSAAGGVGLNALRLLRESGGKIVATVGSESKRGFLAARGLLPKPQIIVRDRRRFLSQLEAALACVGADGADIILDGVGGPYFEPGYRKLRAGGRYVVFGASDFMPRGDRPNPLRLLPRYLNRPRIDPLGMINTNRSVAGFNLIWLWSRLDHLESMYTRALAALPEPPYVGRVFPFQEAPAALAWLKDGGSVGKVVLQAPAG